MTSSDDLRDLTLAAVITTHGRVLDARSQMDILRELWEPNVRRVDIYHEYNGRPEWYPEAYREDHLHRHPPMPHFVGAAHLINEGIACALASGVPYAFIAVASADAWLYDPAKLRQILRACRRGRYEIAASLWHVPVLGTEFFILTPRLAARVFPLDYAAFVAAGRLRRWLNDHTNLQLLEAYFTAKVLRGLGSPRRVYLIPGRQVVSIFNRYGSPGFYASHHSRRWRRWEAGRSLDRLLGQRRRNTPALNELLGAPR